MSAPEPVHRELGDAPSFAGTERSPDRLGIELTIKIGLLVAFLLAAEAVIRPFLSVLLWSVILAVALFPLFDWTRRHLGGRDRISAAFVALLGLAIVFGPAAMLSASAVGSLEALARHVSSGETALPPAPEAIVRLPVIGPGLHAAWAQAAGDTSAFVGKYAHTMVLPGEWLLKAVAALAGSMLMVAAGTGLAALLLPAGPRIVAVINDAALHLVGAQGARFVQVAGATIRNVSRGVIGVAVLQALLVGAALLAFGVPHAGLLALAVLVLAIVQIGPWPAVAALLAWFWIVRGPSGEAAAFGAVMVAAASTEHVVKPFVLGRGLETPMPVILIGLLGGTLAFGLLGLFLGPVLLALAYELLLFWWQSIRNDQRQPAPILDVPAADKANSSST